MDKLYKQFRLLLLSTLLSTSAIVVVAQRVDPPEPPAIPSTTSVKPRPFPKMGPGGRFSGPNSERFIKVDPAFLFEARD